MAGRCFFAHVVSGLAGLAPLASIQVAALSSRHFLPERQAVPEPARGLDDKEPSDVWWNAAVDSDEEQEPAEPPMTQGPPMPAPAPAGPKPQPAPACDEAHNETMNQLYSIIDQANTTFNALEDRVTEATQQCMGSLSSLEEAADDSGADDAKEAVASVGDKLVVLITDIQDSVSPSREKLLSSIQKTASAVAVLRPDVASTFTTATEKVDALGVNATMFTRVNQAQAWWPFGGGGKKPSAFEAAESAVAAANKTAAKVTDALGGVNATAIDSMDELVLGKITAAAQAFQEKCQLIVAAQGADIPEVLGEQAMAVCNSATSVESDVTAIVDTYALLVGEKIAAANASVAVLYSTAAELMGKVQVAKAAADASANATF